MDTHEWNPSFWHSGERNPEKVGFCLILAKAAFYSNDGVEKDHIYLFCDYWTGDHWEDFMFSDTTWHLLYFKPIDELTIPLPTSLVGTQIDLIKYITPVTEDED